MTNATGLAGIAGTTGIVGIAGIDVDAMIVSEVLHLQGGGLTLLTLRSRSTTLVTSGRLRGYTRVSSVRTIWAGSYW